MRLRKNSEEQHRAKWNSFEGNFKQQGTEADFLLDSLPRELKLA
jgi:hypothetical protein